jgi:hypothetical protein
MPQIALTTFLKLWTHNSTRKESEYRKYLTPGGYPLLVVYESRRGGPYEWWRSRKGA